jgi:hypothetical protein
MQPLLDQAEGVAALDRVRHGRRGWGDLVKKAAAAGITPIAQGVGDRPYPGAYILQEALLHKLGADDYGKLLDGQLSFEDPRVVEVFTWVKALVDAGAYPKNFMTVRCTSCREKCGLGCKEVLGWLERRRGSIGLRGAARREPRAVRARRASPAR